MTEGGLPADRTMSKPAADTLDLDSLVLAGAKAKGKRPWFFADANVERILSITMAVAGELAVLRQRLDTIETLLEERGSIGKADIEAFVPSAAQQEARARWNQEYLARILRILQQEQEALERPDEPTSEEAGERIGEE